MHAYTFALAKKLETISTEIPLVFFMINRHKISSSDSSDKHGKNLNSFSGMMCLSPSVLSALKKMRVWVGSLAPSEETISRKEVQSPAIHSFQPLFQNDYAPPSVQTELNSIPSPAFLEGIKTSNPHAVSLTWETTGSRSLFLVQVNVENPDFASCWITYSICMHPKVVVTDIDSNKSCWFRICTLTNEGRSKWSVISLQECTEPITA